MQWEKQELVNLCMGSCKKSFSIESCLEASTAYLKLVLSSAGQQLQGAQILSHVRVMRRSVFEAFISLCIFFVRETNFICVLIGVFELSICVSKSCPHFAGISFLFVKVFFLCC